MEYNEGLGSIRTKKAPKKTGIGYKVFYQKDGKLYPPMVANPGGEDTPIGVWLDADAAPIVGTSKTGRPQVKNGGKGTQGGSGTLAYRPGWHLGLIPYAIQFNRKDENGEKTLFPKDFVWAEVEYAADKNYQNEAEAEGYTDNGKYRHSYAGLKHLPTDGYYIYRTNPNPDTDPWIITGAMKVNRILSKKEVDDLVRKAGREPQRVENGGFTDGFGLGMLVSYDKSFKEMKPVYTVDSDFDSKHINNLAPNENIPESLISTINNGVTLEQLDEIAHLPICYYKTQLTIHGICPTLKNKDVYGYSALMVNQNKSLGVRWLAIDRKKKLKLADYMGLYDWATYYDSQIFCYRKDFEYEDDNKEQVYNKVVDFINGLDKSKFFGYIEVFDHKKMKSNFIIYVGKQKTYFEVVIYMQGIYEKNIQPFVEEISGEKWNETENKFEEWKNEMKRRREEREKEEKERIEESNRKAENRRVEFDKWKKENPFPEKFKPMSFDDLQAGDIVGYYSDSYQFKKSYYRLYLNYKRLCRRECDENGKDLNTWGGHVLKKSDFPNPNELFVYRTQPTKETNTDTEKLKSERPTKGEKVEIVDYASDKVAVLGYTKDKYWELKNLGGGHWDKYITIDGERLQGWVFPRSKRAELEKIFGIEKEEDKKEEEEEVIEEVKVVDEKPTAEIKNSYEFEYRLLGRLKDDCDYYLGNGNRFAKQLWAGNEIDQIKKMVELWDMLPEKPEWLTRNELERYSMALTGKSIDELYKSNDGSSSLLDFANGLSTLLTQGKVTWAEAQKMATEMNVKASNQELIQNCELAVVMAARKIAQTDYTIRAKYEQIRDLYDNQPTIQPKDGESRFLQQFSTPAPLAFMAGEFVKVNDNYNSAYLEPTAGNGMLTIALPADRTCVNELDVIRYNNLTTQGFLHASNQDATKYSVPNKMPAGGLFHGVITNPPFADLKRNEYLIRRGKKGDKEIEYTFTKLDYKLAIMALDQMANNGRAAIIVGGKLGSKVYDFKNAYWNKNDMLFGEYASFVAYLNRQYNLVDILYISGDLYAKQGTTFPIIMLLIDGRKQWDSRIDCVWHKYDPDKDAEIESFTEYFNRIYPHIEGKTETVNNDDKARKLRLAKAKAKALLLYAYAQKNKGRNTNKEESELKQKENTKNIQNVFLKDLVKKHGDRIVEDYQRLSNKKYMKPSEYGKYRGVNVFDAFNYEYGYNRRYVEVNDYIPPSDEELQSSVLEILNKYKKYPTISLPQDEWNYVIKNYKQGISKNPFYKVYESGTDAKYNHKMIDPIGKIIRNSSFDEFYGGGVVD